VIQTEVFFDDTCKNVYPIPHCKWYEIYTGRIEDLYLVIMWGGFGLWG